MMIHSVRRVIFRRSCLQERTGPKHNTTGSQPDFVGSCTNMLMDSNAFKAGLKDALQNRPWTWGATLLLHQEPALRHLPLLRALQPALRAMSHAWKVRNALTWLARWAHTTKQSPNLIACQTRNDKPFLLWAWQVSARLCFHQEGRPQLDLHPLAPNLPQEEEKGAGKLRAPSHKSFVTRQYA